MIVNKEQLDKIEQYAALLLEWNKKINLISRKDEEKVWQNHILHSVSLLFRFRFPKNARIVDIGTGGGLPGIPIKILQPKLEILLIDSRQKKVKALGSILKELALSGISVLAGRAEEISREPRIRHLFDIAVARSVAPLVDLVSWSYPFLRIGEHRDENRPSDPESNKVTVTAPALLAMKGGDVNAEIRQIGHAAQLQAIEVIDLNYDRQQNDKKVVYIKF